MGLGGTAGKEGWAAARSARATRDAEGDGLSGRSTSAGDGGAEADGAWLATTALGASGVREFGTARAVTGVAAVTAGERDWSDGAWLRATRASGVPAVERASELAADCADVEAGAVVAVAASCRRGAVRGASAAGTADAVASVCDGFGAGVARAVGAACTAGAGAAGSGAEDKRASLGVVTSVRADGASAISRGPSARAMGSIDRADGALVAFRASAVTARSGEGDAASAGRVTEDAWPDAVLCRAADGSGEAASGALATSTLVGMSGAAGLGWAMSGDDPTAGTASAGDAGEAATGTAASGARTGAGRGDGAGSPEGGATARSGSGAADGRDGAVSKRARCEVMMSTIIGRSSATSFSSGSGANHARSAKTA